MKTPEIKDLVENELGYRINVNSRKRHIVYGRAIYFKICKDRTNLSLSRIGETLNLNHATVLHSLKKIFPSFELYNPEYMEIYNRIIATEEYIPKHQKLNILQEEHRKLQNRFKYLKRIKIDPKLRPLLKTIQQIPDAQLPEAEYRIQRVIDRLKEYH
jgi:hypothetical protein